MMTRSAERQDRVNVSRSRYEERLICLMVFSGIVPSSGSFLGMLHKKISDDSTEVRIDSGGRQQVSKHECC